MCPHMMKTIHIICYVCIWVVVFRCAHARVFQCVCACVLMASLLSCAETSVSFMLAQSPGILDEQKALRGMKRP